MDSSLSRLLGGAASGGSPATHPLLSRLLSSASSSPSPGAALASPLLKSPAAAARGADLSGHYSTPTLCVYSVGEAAALRTLPLSQYAYGAPAYRGGGALLAMSRCASDLTCLRAFPRRTHAAPATSLRPGTRRAFKFYQVAKTKVRVIAQVRHPRVAGRCSAPDSPRQPPPSHAAPFPSHG
jgi:hypothetical protein